MTGSQKAQLTRTSCDCTYSRGGTCDLIFQCSLSMFQGATSLSARNPKAGAGLAVLRLLNVVSRVLFLRPTESPEFLELTEQLGDKRLCGAGTVSEESLQMSFLLLCG